MLICGERTANAKASQLLKENEPQKTLRLPFREQECA